MKQCRCLLRVTHYRKCQNSSSVQFSRSVMSNYFETPWITQHARPPCPSLTPGVYSNSCPSSWWCHPAISSSVVPFSCPQSLPASGSFPMSQLFAWGGQSIGVSASALHRSKNHLHKWASPHHIILSIFMQLSILQRPRGYRFIQI